MREQLTKSLLDSKEVKAEVARSQMQTPEPKTVIIDLSEIMFSRRILRR